MAEAKFYCESCNKPVDYDAEICPHCGKIFDAVKCPVCKHVGRAESFTNGCPKCGYCAENSNPFPRQKRDFPKGPPMEKERQAKSSLLPPWIYYAIAGGLVLAFLILVFFYLTM